MISQIGWGICLLSILIILVAALGLLRLPDALTRQHAATKAATIAVILFVTGTILIVRDNDWTWRLLIILLFLFFTLPLASHMLSRVAYREMIQAEEKMIAQKKIKEK